MRVNACCRISVAVYHFGLSPQNRANDEVKCTDARKQTAVASSPLLYSQTGYRVVGAWYSDPSL